MKNTHHTVPHFLEIILKILPHIQATRGELCCASYFKKESCHSYHTRACCKNYQIPAYRGINNNNYNLNNI